ncbi:MAG: DNA recombination protein RmuC, partial [Nitrososphaerota archaeon]|nr:DNA recombination protein RmuC [Nitrososphaerota archaeon]
MLLDVLVSISLLCNLVVIGLLIMGRLSGQVKEAIQAQQAALERGQEQLATTVRESLAEARK